MSRMEARAGIEPAHGRFAVNRITTLLSGHITLKKDYNNIPNLFKINYTSSNSSSFSSNSS